MVLCTQLALETAREFNKDVVVDIICFRKLGHNEQDTPALTQPLMYKKIGQHPARAALRRQAGGAGRAAEGPDEMVRRLPRRDGRRQAHRRPGADQLPEEQVRRRLGAVPGNQVDRRRRHRACRWRDQAPGRAHHHGARKFKVHPLVRRVADRAAMGRGEINVDWGHGRALAFVASLAASGYAVRLSGEDCGHGTFTHRHAVLHDQNREKWDVGHLHPAGERRRQARRRSS